MNNIGKTRKMLRRKSIRINTGSINNTKGAMKDNRKDPLDHIRINRCRRTCPIKSIIKDSTRRPLRRHPREEIFKARLRHQCRRHLLRPLPQAPRHLSALTIS